MILYFCDRYMTIKGIASDSLNVGLIISDDVRTEEVETGSSSLECKINYTLEEHAEAKTLCAAGNYILMESAEGTQEYYTIIDSEDDTSKRSIDIYAEDAGLDLLNETVSAYTADSAHPIAWYIEKFAYDTGFQLGTNEIADRSRTLSWDGEDTQAKRLLSVATQFDAEISYRFTVDGLKVTGKYIDVWKTRGKESGVILRMGREVDSITEKQSVADLATGLWVTGGTPDATDDNPDPQPITLNGYTYDDGDFYVSGNGLFSRNALKKWTRYLTESGTDQGYIMVPYTYDTTSQSELFAHALTELKSRCDVSITYEVDLTTLAKDIRIGDTVRIVDESGKLYLTSRVLKLEVSECDKTQKATLGDYQIESSDMSSMVETQQKLLEWVSKRSVLHTWIAYADDDEGTNISLEKGSHGWVGIAPNRISADPDISDPSVYAWAKIVEQPGPPSIVISSSEGNLFKSEYIKTTLSAVIFQDGEQLSSDDAAKIGTICWYDEDDTKLGEGTPIDISSSSKYEQLCVTCRLVSSGRVKAENKIWMNSTMDLSQLIDTAQTTADSAKTTAESASSTASSAKETAESASSAASTAQSAADGAKSAADTAQTTANGAIGTAQTLYYASGSTSVPSKPTSAVTASSTTTYDTWETVLPTYSEQYPYLYTCSQTKTQAGKYAWTNVVTGSYADYIDVPASKVQTSASDDLEEAVATLRDETDTKLSDQKTQTDSDIKDAVDKSSTSLTSSMNDMKSQLEEAIKGNSDAVSQLKQWLTFDEDNGLRVGETGTGYYIRIKGERISFMYGDSEMYYLSNSKLYIKDAQITSTLSFGQDTAQWAFVPRTNGNLTFRWIGG